ncbi:MAG TPA: RNA 3'-terminal phosphate cyclase [Acidiferrobacterales bacterium]
MLDLDGAYGEGGGQLLRTACALSAITGQAVRIHDIRARRRPPGLAPQHLTAVKAVATLCGAQTDGLELRSQTLTFRPGQLRGGEFRFDVGTAGSVTLVLQALLPAALFCSTPIRIHLIGGTDVRGAPPFDYLRFVFLPLLARMGADVKLTLLRRGYYPRGGGEITAEVWPGRLGPLRLEAAGAPEEIRGIVHVANLPAHIAMRMHQTAVQALSDLAPVEVEQLVLDRSQAVGQGGAIVLWAHCGQALLGGSEVAQRGIAAERIAENAAQALRAEIRAGATLDIHAADQIPVYAALAHGRSSFLVRDLSAHAQTVLWLLTRFLPVHVHTAAAGACTRLDIEPGARREGKAGVD